MPPRGQVLTGARARFSVDGVPIAYTTSCSWGEEIQHEAVEPLDQFDVAEHVPVSYRVTLSAQVVRVIRNSIKLHSGLGLMPTLEGILDKGEMTGTIEDPKTGAVLANIQGVRCTGYTADTRRGITLTNVSFVARRTKDESEVV